MRAGTLTLKSTIGLPEVGGTFFVSGFGKCVITAVAIADAGIPFYDVTFQTT